MFSATKILRFPLRSVKYISENIYGKSPQKDDEGIKVVTNWYKGNEAMMERRGIENLEIR